MNDTAQLAGAAETELSVADAADVFKAYTSEQPVKPRDEQGRFAPSDEELAETEAEEAEQAEPEQDEADEDEAEAAQEAQPLPPSWPADKAEVWEALPADAQAFIAERDAEQLRATNAKLQESANARKAAEALQEEASTNRTQYAEALDVVISALQPIKPDPRAFGAGTGQYDRESFDLATAQYEEQAAVLSQFIEQKAAIQQQQAQESDAKFDAWKREHEAVYAPKFVADLPELADQSKAEPVVRSLIDYAIAQGIEPENFASENVKHVTSAQMHILWKAQQFDKLRQGGQQPKPKPAGPAVKPGVSSPRSAQRNVQGQRVMDRLAREGSVDAGAAMFKHLFSGNKR